MYNYMYTGCIYSILGYAGIPAYIYKHYIIALQVHDVELTLDWRPFDVVTSQRRHFDVMCLLGVTKKVCKKLSDLENEIYRVQ